MFDFIKKYKYTVLVVIIIALGVGAYFGYNYYIEQKYTYNPNVSNDIEEIVKYDVNEYTVIYKDDLDVYRAYYKEFLRTLADEPAKAYNMLEADTKSSEFNNSYDNFMNYQKSLDKSILKTSDIIKYTKNNNVIYVIDKYNNHYEFYENGVWNFTVKLYK